MNPKAYRLPRYALPRRYDIHIEAGLGSADFGGSVAIDLDIREARDVIEMHARDLQLAEATLDVDGRKLTGEVEIDKEQEVARVRFREPLPVGQTTLTIPFKGQISQGLDGIYLAKNGPEELICTQCEATSARAIFPCFDEPAFKARFAWEVTTLAGATVLANSPLQSVTPNVDGQTKTWTFAPTKPMSSYLVALVIGDVAGTAEEIVQGTPIRVWALRGKEHMGRFAHAYTARLLPWFEGYFGVPYHYDKYDQVAVPGFGAGAMENSGLVLFRQALLLMDPQTTSWAQEKSIALVVAHEFAHQWFGNLVTMQWWDDLWLNEAFAEWIAYKVVDTLSPDYKIWDEGQPAIHAAFRTDALDNTHPIYTPIQTAAEAEEIFDVITYQKGFAVLRMLEHFLEPDVFRAGIRTYMQEFGERNATGADLWRHLQQASQAPVLDIMQSWIMQPGYPCIDVVPEHSGDGFSLHLSQKRFFSNPARGDQEGQIWQVPLVIRYEDGDGVHEMRCLMPEHETSVQLKLSGTLKWCFANADAIGFYRQNLHPQLLDALLANLDRLETGEQMGLLDDQWALVRNGTQRIGQFLDGLSAMMRTRDHELLGQIVGHLQQIDGLLQDAGDEEALRRFRSWVDDALQPKLAELGFDACSGESQSTAQLRAHVVRGIAAIARNPEAIREAERRQQREADDPAAVDPNLAPVFVQAAAEAGDAARYDSFIEIYQRRRSSGAPPQETDRYLYSFPRFRPPELVERTFEIIDEEVVPREAIFPLVRQMLGLRHARQAAWEYIKREWDKLQGIGQLAIGRLVEATGLLPVSLRDDIVAFYDAHLNGMAPTSYARALEAMDQYAEFQARTRDDLVARFKNT